MVHVVLFSGGRGSGALSEQLAADPAVHLSVVINGYDDGASTGRVRRFLGACLGPSDFRKNASRLARLRGSCLPELIELLDARLPVGCPASLAESTLRGWLAPSSAAVQTVGVARIQDLVRALPVTTLEAVARRLGSFFAEWHASTRPLDFSDCAVGNLVFAGSVLIEGRNFNAAVDDYCSLLGLPPGLVCNVSDGTNAHLVALNTDGGVLATEEAIVDARRRNHVREIYLLPALLTDLDEAAIGAMGLDERADFLASHTVPVPLNPALGQVLADADLIVFAPGTQHSSLFPSYLTKGLSRSLARNLRATKLLITNIEPDAEIAGRTAVDIVERAMFYLTEKGTLRLPAPALITHYIINDPGTGGRARVPMGRLDALDDPRMVRIAHYEDGVSGRHDAAKVLTPFLGALMERARRPRVAVVMHDVDSTNKLCQTVIEMIRGGATNLPADVRVLYGGLARLEPDFAETLPFPVARIAGEGSDWGRAVMSELEAWNTDHVVLFESSGMYRGEDIPSLVTPLLLGQSDAVWGSRRLSSRDVGESYRMRYRHNVLRGTASFVGSYVLSLACVVLFGRYIADTLSGARALRFALFRNVAPGLPDAGANPRLLAAILRARATIHEIPARFVPLSPERVKRATIYDGLSALATMVACRFSRRSSSTAGSTEVTR